MSPSRSRITRRSMLAACAALTSTALVACGGGATAAVGASSGTSAAGASTAASAPSSTVSAASTSSAATASAVAPTTSKVAAAGQTLKVMKGGAASPTWNALVATFKSKSGITVDTLYTTGTVEDGTVPTALKSGSGPDIVNVNSGPARVGFLAQDGLIKSLDDAYKQYNWNARLVPSVIDILKQESKLFQGKFWEVPNTVDVIYWDYNQDMFAKAGVKPPATYNDMEVNFAKLKDGGVYPITIGVRSSFAGGWLFGNLIQATAGRDGVAEVLFGSGKWTQPAFVQASQIMQDWVKKEYIPKAASTLTDQQAWPLFESKKAANYCVGTWFIPTMYNDKVDVANVDTYETPPITTSGTKSPTGGFGNSYVVAADTKVADAAYQFLDYLLSDEVILSRVNDPHGGDIPPTKIPADAKPNRLLAKALDILGKEGTGYNPSVWVVSTITTVYYQSLQGLLGGLTTPEKAMADVQAAKEKAQQA